MAVRRKHQVPDDDRTFIVHGDIHLDDIEAVWRIMHETKPTEFESAVEGSRRAVEKIAEATGELSGLPRARPLVTMEVTPQGRDPQSYEVDGPEDLTSLPGDPSTVKRLFLSRETSIVHLWSSPVGAMLALRVNHGDLERELLDHFDDRAKPPPDSWTYAVVLFARILPFALLALVAGAVGLAQSSTAGGFAHVNVAVGLGSVLAKFEMHRRGLGGRVRIHPRNAPVDWWREKIESPLRDYTVALVLLSILVTIVVTVVAS